MRLLFVDVAQRSFIHVLMFYSIMFDLYEAFA